MTSDQIKSAQTGQFSDSQWLREIALQLALLNEKPSTPAPAPNHQFQKARK